MVEMDAFICRVKSERAHHAQIGWKDENNTAFAWVCYIVNYASRFAIPSQFNTNKYDFGTCMVKTAALCMAAYEWWLEHGHEDLDV